MKLLGIRVCEHDSNFSYFDGKNLRYFKSERLNGIKHHAYNDLYIWRDVIKDKFGDNPDTIDEIAIVLDPWLYKNKPWDKKNENFFPSIDYPHINANCPVYRVDHHYAHALSVYDDFDVHMVFDGFGDKEISWSIIKNDKIIERGDFSKHGSLGAELGGAARLFDIKAVHTADLAGKLMGLQSYGTFNKEFYKTLSYDIYQVIDLYNIKNWEYFKGDYKVSCLTALDWIKTTHEKSGEILLETFKKYCNKSDKICFTGGVAQNVIWNTKLKDYFNNLHVPPHTPDEGRSLGAIEFLRKKFGKSLFKLILLMTIFYMFIFLCAEVTAISVLINYISGTEFWITALVVLTSTLIYTLYGGLKASIFTDNIQMIVIGVLLIISFIYITSFTGSKSSC